MDEAPVRTTLLYVDNLNLDHASLNRVKQALRQFVNEQLTDQDMVALATSGGSLGIGQKFTRNRQILRYAIEQIQVGPQVRKSLFTPALAARVVKEGPVDYGRGLDEEILKALEEEMRRQHMLATGRDLIEEPGPDRQLTKEQIGKLIKNDVRLATQVGTSSNEMRLAVDIIRRETGVYCPCRMVRTQAINRALRVLSEASYTRKSTLAALGGLAEQMSGLPGKRMLVVFRTNSLRITAAGILTMPIFNRP